MKKTEYKIVVIIPARGGSKGIPKKNLIPFCGKPLLAWSIVQAQGSRYVKGVYVTSDSSEILKVSQGFGAQVIRRPKTLSTDQASSEAALLHALNQIEAGTSRKIDLVVFLQATSPVRTSQDIDEAIELLDKEKGDSLFSAAPMQDVCLWGYKDNILQSVTYDYKRRGRRQDRQPYFLENGSIYIFKPEILRRCHNRLGGKVLVFSMPLWKSFEIDEIGDIEICAHFMKKVLRKKEK